MKPMKFRILSLLLIVTISNAAHAQKEVDPAQLIGSWILEKQLFIEPDEDSVEIRKESIGIILSFQSGNRFTTRRRNGTSTSVIDTGTYTIDARNRQIVQNDTECIIVVLSNNSLILRVDESVELHFKKIKGSVVSR